MSGLPAGDVERRRREVEPTHVRPKTRQRKCVAANVALQMNTPQATDVAEQRQVELHDTREVLRIVEQFELVARFVKWHAAVPVGHVDLRVVGEVDVVHSSSKLFD